MHPFLKSVLLEIAADHHAVIAARPVVQHQVALIPAEVGALNDVHDFVAVGDPADIGEADFVSGRKPRKFAEVIAPFETPDAEVFPVGRSRTPARHFLQVAVHASDRPGPVECRNAQAADTRASFDLDHRHEFAVIAGGFRFISFGLRHVRRGHLHAGLRDRLVQGAQDRLASVVITRFLDPGPCEQADGCGKQQDADDQDHIRQGFTTCFRLFHHLSWF